MAKRPSCHEVLQRPWDKVAVDLFSLNQKDYLVTVDYYSGYWELDRLHRTDAETVVKKLKAHFARHGNPCQLVSNNGTQFVADEFQKMTKAWDTELHLPITAVVKSAK